MHLCAPSRHSAPVHDCNIDTRSVCASTEYLKRDWERRDIVEERGRGKGYREEGKKKREGERERLEGESSEVDTVLLFVFIMISFLSFFFGVTSAIWLYSTFSFRAPWRSYSIRLHWTLRLPFSFFPFRLFLYFLFSPFFLSPLSLLFPKGPWDTDIKHLTPALLFLLLTLFPFFSYYNITLVICSSHIIFTSSCAGDAVFTMPL